MCALKWGDIDFERKTISVRRTLQRLCKTEDEKTASTNKTIIVEGPVKTDNSYRDVPIQNKIFDKLLEYQMQQQDEKEAAGCCYEDNDYIFASPIGGVVEPSTMRDMYKRLLKKSNIRDTSFHALRHTFATRAIENNVPIKAVSDILGHSTVQITMDIYYHPSIDLKRDAVDKMADLW